MPAELLGLIKSYYSSKFARVSVEGLLSEPFELCTGLGQGCCLAPLLFNIYFGAVMESWSASAPDRLSWFSWVDGALRRQCDLDKYMLHTAWTFQELGFADDLALIADTLSKLQTAYRNISRHLSAWGLTVSTAKTEALVTLTHRSGPLCSDSVDSQPVLFSFKYLGSHIDSFLTCEPDILYRLDQARKAFWKLATSVWHVPQLALITKIRVYRACVLSVLLYGSETWTVNFPLCVVNFRCFTLLVSEYLVGLRGGCKSSIISQTTAY